MFRFDWSWSLFLDTKMTQWIHLKWQKLVEFYSNSVKIIIHAPFVRSHLNYSLYFGLMNGKTANNLHFLWNQLEDNVYMHLPSNKIQADKCIWIKNEVFLNVRNFYPKFRKKSLCVFCVFVQMVVFVARLKQFSLIVAKKLHLFWGCI